MSRSTLSTRVQTILDRLDARIERQTMIPGADVVTATSVVGVFHTAAGHVERKLLVLHTVPDPVRWFAAHLRVLRKVVDSHRLIVRMRAHELRLRARGAS